MYDSQLLRLPSGLAWLSPLIMNMHLQQQQRICIRGSVGWVQQHMPEALENLKIDSVTAS
jgi:hypothetical protein